MNWREYVDENEVRKTLSVLKPNGELFEIRILKQEGSRKKVISGYFTDPDKFFQKLDTINCKGASFYLTLNSLNEALDSRTQHNALLTGCNTTSDKDVDEYQWFFVDLDPVRPTGVSSTDEELQEACKVAGKVASYLDGLGFYEPVKALSGNGCHLLYRIQMENTKENVGIIERSLKVLASMFNTDKVEVDTTNYNPARICKLHGTLAQKGADTEERPHRMSRIFSAPKEAGITETIYLYKLASELTLEDETPSPNYGTTQSYMNAFDLPSWLDKYHMTYNVKETDRAKIYELDECPFDSSHTNGDAKVFQYSNGAVAFKCHHNSCRDKKWQDVRMKFEPEAYQPPEADQRYEKGWAEHNRAKAEEQVTPQEITPTAEDVFRTASQILEDPEPEYEYVKTGINYIDRIMGGLAKTELTCISGPSGAGKSTFLCQIMLSAVNEGQRVICYSGEMSNKKYVRWMLRQAAGRTKVEQSEKVEGEYNLKSAELEWQIADWIGDKFWLYNNRYGNDFRKIMNAIKAQTIENKADLIVIDNLMILDITALSQEKYDAQTAFVRQLKALALETNTHVLFVAHPRKTPDLLKLTDIAGSSNIGNMLDNAFAVYRFTNGFQKAYETENGATDFPPAVTNIVDVLKSRETGYTNTPIPLWYEPSTKRLKNSPEENVCYGWQDDEEADKDIEELFEPVDDPVPF